MGGGWGGGAFPSGESFKYVHVSEVFIAQPNPCHSQVMARAMKITYDEGLISLFRLPASFKRHLGHKKNGRGDVQAPWNKGWKEMGTKEKEEEDNFTQHQFPCLAGLVQSLTLS